VEARRKVAVLPVASIRTDGGTQPRAALDYTAVDGYMDDMQAGAKFPPVVVFYDGADYWLADGFHRTEAAFGAEREEIECEIHQGTLADAQWYSFSANKTNSLRRTNEDKHRVVKAALVHPMGAGKSDSAIAKHVGVDSQTVANWRKKLESTSEIRKSEKRTGADGRTISTSNIGKKPVEIRQAQEAPRPAPGKRQEILANAVRNKIIIGLSQIDGVCRGLAEVNISLARDGWDAEEVRGFADIADKCSKQLRACREELLKGIAERRTA
jgi:transposase-like protein